VGEGWAGVIAGEGTAPMSAPIPICGAAAYHVFAVPGSAMLRCISASVPSGVMWLMAA
jgi:hypothetical protein